ncbi:putative cationic amino acid transporter [Mycobacteroides abscessus subsp. massiliense]|nr:putative cationic amino acid transporter [Mycobacteroides abscessus subsp. massiliense]
MVLMLGQIRVIFAMCRDGLLPRELARTGSHGTPIRITLIVGFLVAVAASLTPIEGLEEIVNVGTLFAFVLVSAGVIVLRRSRPDLPRSFRTPGVPWLPIVAIVACGWLMLNLAVRTWLFALSWMVVGVIVYFAYSRRHSVLGLRVAVEQ